MDPRFWREVRAHFDELVGLTPQERAQRLAAIAASGAALHDAIVAMLAADAAADAWLSDVEAALCVRGTPPRAEPPGDPFGLCGRMLAHFRVHELLGRGGMGVVYRAEDTRLNRAVALKVPLSTGALDASASARFLNEARSAAALDHPNLCSIYEAGEVMPGQPFLAMPLYSGETLRERLARDGALPVDDALSIAMQIACGLAALHDAGIVHRDVKPGNVMLLPDGAVKILDFGLAKVRDLTLTVSRAQLGTAAYMAPEQIRREQIDGRTDLWALGVMLYEMLSGRRPFEGDDDVSIAHAIVHEEPLRPSTPDGALPPALDRLLRSLLHKQPAQRPGTAHRVAADLGAIREGGTPSGWRAWQRRWAIPGWQQRRSRRRTVGALSAAVLVLAAGTLLATRPPHRPAAPVAPVPGSIAVLPFANISGDPLQEYLSDGVTDELTRQLARIEGLHVTAWHSAFQLRGRDGDLREVGRALGVATVLRGSVHRSAGHVRIAAQMLDAATGQLLWSATFDRDVGEMFAVHDEIAQAIVGSFAPRLGRTLTAPSPPTRHPEAYELYMKGRYFLNQRTEEAIVRGAEYFRQAVALDPDFAAAHAGLADAEIAPRSGHPAPRFARASAAAARALALDSLLPEAHITMSWLLLWYERDRAGAERHIRRAVQLSPGSIWAVVRYGAFLAATGRVEESLPVLQRGHAIDPLSHVHATHLGTHYLWLSREAEAMVYFRKALEVQPDYYMAHWGLGRAYLLQGRYPEALAELAYEGGDYVGFSGPGLRGHAHALAGNEAEARRLLAGLTEKAGRGEYVAPVNPAIIHIALGEKAQALDWLERVEAERGARIFLIDPIFDPIRDEPRFQQLRRRLGLE